MTLATWLTLATVCFLGAISPGPSLALMIRNTVAGGTSLGLATAIGHGVGVGLYALITAMGLGLVISQTPWLFSAIQYGGAAFLIYTAFRILTATRDSSAESEEHPERFSGFSGGFLVAFLNPKLALFFLALFSQFVSSEYQIFEQFIMTITAGSIDAIWYALVVVGIGRTQLLSILKRNGIWVDRLSAVIFVMLALFVLLQ